MSLKLTRQVWKMPLPTTEKFVLLALADHANDEGVCWPSQSALADATGCSKRTIIKAVKTLQESGLVEVKKSGQNQNQYQLSVVKILHDADSSLVKQVHYSSAAGSPLVVQEIHYSSAADSLPYIEEPPKNHQIEPPKNHHSSCHQQAGDDGKVAAPPVKKPKPKPEHEIDPLGKSNPQFCEFYDNYLNKKNRKAAFRAFLRLKAADRDLLIARTNEANAGMFSIREQKYIPHPATWINSLEWQDDTADLSAPQPQLHNGFVHSGSRAPVRDEGAEYDILTGSDGRGWND